MKINILSVISAVCLSIPAIAQLADAGDDMYMCPQMGSISLGAQPIEQPCSGVWTQISGPTEVVFSDVNNPNSQVAASELGTYVLKWSVVESAECNASSDEMNLIVYEPGCQLAVVSPPQVELFNATSCQLDATEPEYPVIGIWSQISGPSTVVFENVYDPNTTVSNLTVGIYLLQWTIPATECCPENSYNFTIYNFDISVVVSAGSDIELCLPQTSTQLAAEPLEFPFSGYWTVVSGGGTFTNMYAYNTTVTDIPVGVNVYSWTLNADSGCGIVNSDTVLVTLLECPPLLGDLNGDGEITIEEFNEVVGAFGCIAVECSQYDLNGDGIVGIDDLLILIANMGG